MSIQQVKAFYEKLSQDEAFRDQIRNVSSKEECSRIVKAAGYDFRWPRGRRRGNAVRSTDFPGYEN